MRTGQMVTATARWLCW